MAASRGEHARVTNGTLIHSRYEVLGEIGCGNFSKVYACRDTKAEGERDDVVALKLLKKEYCHDAKFENEILRALKAHTSDGSEKVLTLNEHFYWNRFPCFVFPIMGGNLRTRRLGVGRGYVSMEELRRLSVDMLSGLSFLHFRVGMVHTDLKPDNILLDSVLVSKEGLGDGWTIADFGSASFYKPEKLDTDLISTRPYRAPEVVMGGQWYYPTDMWSLGCILFEVYTGCKLFDAVDDGGHLAQMEMRLGPLPPSLSQRARNSRKYFDARGSLLRRAPDSTRLPRISEELSSEPALCDLIMAMLRYEPERRIRADDALHHPFIVGSKKSPSPARRSVPVRSHLTPLNNNAAKKFVIECADYDASPTPSLASIQKSVDIGRVDPSRLPAAGKVTRQLRPTRLW
jgi:serine/threonine protein kinase